MIPILYASNTTNYDNNGLGGLNDAISCVITEERNSTYELEMKYPVSGAHYSEIALSNLIKAPNYKGGNGQLFRIYKITKPINGKVTIYAEHVSYQLSQIPVMPFSDTSSLTCSEAWNLLKANTAEDCPYDFSTDITATSSDFEVEIPTSMRSMLGGTDGSLLDHFHGEYEWDNYTVKLWKARGANNGVTLRYGKNITDIEQEENIENTVTGICPYWKGTITTTDSSGETTTEDKVVYYTDESTGSHVLYSDKAENFPYKRTSVVDFSSYYNSEPTNAQLKTAAEDYISDNNIGLPDVDLSLSYVDLTKCTEYAGKAPLETIKLCDTITVIFEKLGISTTAKVTKVKYNVLKEMYDSIDIGSVSTNLAKTITTMMQDTVATDTKISKLNTYVAKSTQAITGNSGGYVVLHDGDGDGKPDEILVMEKESINDPENLNIWRFNKNGLGHSSTGYNGTFTTAILQNGTMVADFIATGVLSDLNGNYTLNMSTGEVKMSKAEMTGSSSMSKTYASGTDTSAIISKIRNILLGLATPTYSEARDYDLSCNGEIDLIDTTYFTSVKAGNIGLIKTDNVTAYIDPSNSEGKAIRVVDNATLTSVDGTGQRSGTLETDIGAGLIGTNQLFAKNGYFENGIYSSSVTIGGALSASGNIASSGQITATGSISSSSSVVGTSLFYTSGELSSTNGLVCSTYYNDTPAQMTVPHATWTNMAGVTVAKAGYYLVIGSVHQPAATDTAEKEVGIDLYTTYRLAKVSMYQGGTTVFHADSQNQVVWFGALTANTAVYVRAWQSNTTSVSVVLEGTITVRRIG